MLRLRILSFLLIPLMFGCANGSTVAIAGTTILILAEDNAQGAIPRSDRRFKRVLNGVSDLLNTEGYDVFDETAVTTETYDQGSDKNRRRTVAELLHMARGITQPPINVLVMLQVEARTDPPKYGSVAIHVTARGRLLNVQTGQRIGNYEYVGPKSWRTTPACALDRDCILEKVGDKVKIIGEDVGAILENKLSAMAGPAGAVSSSGTQCIPNAYELTFSGFKTADYGLIESYIVQFKGYKKHNLTSGTKRRSVYWYNSCIGSALLNRSLDDMFDLLDMKSHVSFSGKKFEIRKIRVRKSR